MISSNDDFSHFSESKNCIALNRTGLKNADAACKISNAHYHRKRNIPAEGQTGNSDALRMTYFFYLRGLNLSIKSTKKMGKGDIKSRKGKLANGSFGKSRKRNETMAKSVPAAAAVTAEPVQKKAPARAKAKKA